MILKAKSLHKSFYHPTKIDILKGVDLEVEKGETVAITGRSGQGKSTLLQILGTLDAPCKGSLEIAGHDVSKFNKSKIRNTHIAFIFQSFHLLEDYTALENVLMPSYIARKSIAIGSESYAHALELLNYVGLKDRADHSAKLLSGGEKQRVAIARALSNNPDIIFGDEPSGNLDKQTAGAIHALLLNYARERQKAMIFVTHDQDLANLCDKQYVLQDGFLLLT